MLFQTKHPGYEHLHKKWTSRHKAAKQGFLQKHADVARHLAVGGIGSLMLLTIPGTQLLPEPKLIAQQTTDATGDGVVRKRDTTLDLQTALRNQVPEEVRKLSPEEEDKIAQTLTNSLGIAVKPEIDGMRLNRSYGLIGGEQHLYRYPGDTVYKHAKNTTDWAMYGGSGIAPGLGAWGYFAPSESQMTPKDEERERWYIATQTFLAPGFAENPQKFKDFFKYRKMVVVNPQTGQAVVTDIADAGPAEFTGKHLGGSPEVMEAVGLAKGPRKGAVLYFFIDDPSDTIPLGPIAPKEENLPQVAETLTN
jgi:hypothetical protein